MKSVISITQAYEKKQIITLCGQSKEELNGAYDFLLKH